MLILHREFAAQTSFFDNGDENVFQREHAFARTQNRDSRRPQLFRGNAYARCHIVFGDDVQAIAK
jgi:hypothetical protein